MNDSDDNTRNEYEDLYNYEEWECPPQENEPSTSLSFPLPLALNESLSNFKLKIKQHQITTRIRDTVEQTITKIQNVTLTDQTTAPPSPSTRPKEEKSLGLLSLGQTAIGVAAE